MAESDDEVSQPWSIDLGPASEENRQLARMVSKAFGGSRTVNVFWDDGHKSHIDILSARDSPGSGIISYSTLGLSDFPNLVNAEAYPVRAEFVSACRQDAETFPNAVASAALKVINEGASYCPGAILVDVFAINNVPGRMRHFLVEVPFCWTGLSICKFKSKTVDWLQLVPISDGERVFAHKKGAEALADMLQQAESDVFDLDRPEVA